MNDRAAEKLLADQVRDGDSDAWQQLIERYEGRLLAFARSRLRQRSAAEDIVQEAFIGFLVSLPNFDSSRPLEGYLFSICAHKLTDYLRREGRRPALPFSAAVGSNEGSLHLPAAGRGPSSIIRNAEQQDLEEASLIDAIQAQVDRWRQKENWRKLSCIELLMVRRMGNKQVAEQLSITEQQVANYKSDFLTQLKKAVRSQELPTDIFPELSDPS